MRVSPRSLSTLDPAIRRGRAVRAADCTLWQLPEGEIAVDGDHVRHQRSRRASHSSRVCAPDVDRLVLERRRQLARARGCASPGVGASACEATLSGSMEWITSVQPSVSKAQSIEAIAASVRVALAPVRARRSAQPTSVPGQPSGCHGPSCRPIRPWPSRSPRTCAKPCSAHAPGICRNLRHAAARGCGAADVAARLLVRAATPPRRSKSSRAWHAQQQAFGFECSGAQAAIAAPPDQNALMPVSSRPITSWCTVSVPS